MTCDINANHARKPDKKRTPERLCRSDTEWNHSTPLEALESRPPRLWRSFTIAFALSSLCGCGTQATIELKNGGLVEGRIVEKRGAFLVAENERQGVFAVHEQQVQQVRHPGTGAIIAGGILVGAAAALATSALLRDCSESDEPGCRNDQNLALLAGGVCGATGLGIGLYGLGVNDGSRDRARGSRESSRACLGCGHAIGFVGRF